jgi:lipoate-protein ligase B
MSPWEKLVCRDVSWNDLCRLEDSLVAQVEASRAKRFLLVSEPRPVYTAGRHADPAGLLCSRSTLEREGIDVAVAPRGGQWTYHGPGQVLLYPIVALETLGLGSRSVRTYADRFRRAVVTVLRATGVDAVSGDKPYGVYLGDAKLASFGLAFRRGIAAHGVAVYLTDQRAAFRRIHPCGVPDAPVTSVAEVVARTDWRTFADGLAEAVAREFP